MSEILLSLLIVLVFFTSVVFIYKWTTGIYPASKMIITPPPITHSGLEPQQAKFMFFFTTWCPHCKNAEPAWKSFQQQLKTRPATYGGYTIQFEDINAESNVGKTSLYKVDAYPTFKVETTKRVVEMKGVPDVLIFDAFLVAALGPKKFTS
jgi:thiol-disulfide isomerase/thioredoxin